MNAHRAVLLAARHKLFSLAGADTLICWNNIKVLGSLLGNLLLGVARVGVKLTQKYISTNHPRMGYKHTSTRRSIHDRFADQATVTGQSGLALHMPVRCRCPNFPGHDPGSGRPFRPVEGPAPAGAWEREGPLAHRPSSTSTPGRTCVI